MCSQFKRCGMVRTDKDFYILVLEFVKQLAEYLFVNKAYCLYLIVNLITMTASGASTWIYTKSLPLFSASTAA